MKGELFQGSFKPNCCFITVVWQKSFNVMTCNLTLVILAILKLVSENEIPLENIPYYLFEIKIVTTKMGMTIICV